MGIVLKAAPSVIDRWRYDEEASYTDTGDHYDDGTTHVFVILGRAKSRIWIESNAEAKYLKASADLMAELADDQEMWGHRDALRRLSRRITEAAG